MSDGTLWFDTKVDTAGFNEGMNKVTAASKKSNEAQLKAALDNAKKLREAWLEATLKDPSGKDPATQRAKDAYDAAQKMATAMKYAAAESVTAGKATASSFSAISSVLSAVGGAITGVGVAVAIITAAVVALVVAIGAMIAGVIVLGKAAYEALQNLVNEMWSTMARSQAIKIGIDHIKNAFDSVKQASYAAFLPLIEFAAPYIKMITDFLINMFNLLGRIIAALLGQGKAWQYVAGSTKQATAAAQDNLAAWDQINVLAKGQGEANAGAGKFIQVDVEEDLLKNTWTNIKNWLREHIVQPITDWFLDMWDIVVEYAGIAWGKVQEWWAGVETWWYENITVPIQNAFGAAWDYITIWARDIWVLIKFWFTEGVRGLGLIKDELVRVWNNAWEDVKKGAKLYYDKIMEYWIPFAEWFGNTVTKPVKNAWRAALNAIGSGFNAFSSGAAGVLTSFVNGIIGVVNRAVSVVIEFINKIAEALNKVGSVVPGWKTIPTVATPSFGGVVIPPLVKFAPLPELASGAVIPPNSRFAAVLGDQTSGMNIEAPETLIRQIISEEMGNIKAEITIDFAGTMGQFVRDLKPYITREDVRVGKNLVEGNIT